MLPARGDKIMAAPPDLISNQADAVLGTIVSLLPTRDGCRTQVLSRRWRHIWRSAPLNLAAGRRGRNGRLPDYNISKILSSHLGPVRRIHIIGIGPLWYRTRRHEVIDEAACDARIDGWVGSWDVVTGLEVLDLCYSYHGEVLPASVFRLAPALRVASFTRCRLPANLVVDFPCLERLSLYSVTLTEEALCAMLSGCPALRSLLLEKNVGFERLRISSPTLRSIGFYYSRAPKAQELVIHDAPSLDRLLLLDLDFGYPSSRNTIRLVHAPKLKILGWLSNTMSQLHLGTTVFQNMMAASLTTTMPAVKVLALDYVGPDLDPVLDILRCFTCLESLYISLDYIPPNYRKNVRKYASPYDPVECLEFHLKKVAFMRYPGMPIDVELARFFLLNAKVIAKMEFGIIEYPKDEWKANQNNTLLQLQDGASRDVRFEFTRLNSDTLNNENKNERTHDLSMADPLGSSF